MKKFLSIFLVSILVLSIALTSCGGDTGNSEPNTPGGSSSNTPGSSNNGSSEKPGSSANDSTQTVIGVEGLDFSKNDDKESYSVSSVGTCNTTDIVVPNTYKDKPVTGIGADAFSGCATVKSITLPDTIKTVGYNAFAGCINLKYTEYENGKYLGSEQNPHLVLVDVIDTTITSYEIAADTAVIYDSAFADCTALTSIVIPNTVTSLGSDVFRNCTSLKSVTLGTGITAIPRNAFYNCYNLTSVVIPDSVTSIDSHAFYYCSCLKTVSLSNALESVSTTAFLGCSVLEYTAYNNAKYLGNEENPYYLLVSATDIKITECTVAAQTKIVNTHAFFNCTAITAFSYEGTVDEWYEIELADDWDDESTIKDVSCSDGTA